MEMQNDIKALLACCHSCPSGGWWLVRSNCTLLIALLYPALFGGVLSDQEFVLKYLYMPSKPNYFIPET